MKKRSSLQRGIKRLRYLSSTLLLTLVMTAGLVSCDDIFNAILDTGAPVSLTASNGTYANRIEVNWSAPSLSSEKWQGKSVEGYTVQWWGPENGSGETSAGLTSFTINVNPANRAKEYQIEVTTIIDGEWKGSSTDTGFALETFDLIWKDGGSGYSFSGTDRWYVTMLQKGFRYDFEFMDGEEGWIQFYNHGTLDMVHETGNTGVFGANTSPSWVCNENGDWHKFYVRVVPAVPVPDTTSFRAGYGF